MSIRQTIVGVSLALAVIVSGAGAQAETPWPLKTPAELKALHGPTFVGMQILTYRFSQEPPQPGAPSQVVIGIGNDVIFRDDGGNRRIVDLKLGRIYGLSTDKNFTNHPMAADLIWRDTENRNRKGMVQALADMLKAAPPNTKPPPPEAVISFEPFWVATDLKVPDSNEAPQVEMRESGGETTYLYKGAEVLRWRSSKDEIPAALKPNVRRAFLWFFRGHPHLTDKLTAPGRMPQQYVVHWRMVQPVREEYQLVSSRWCADCEALPADAKPVLKMGGGVFESHMAPIMIAASQGKYAATSSDEYLNRVSASLDKAAGVEAFLWFAERALQYGAQQCTPQDDSKYCAVQNRLASLMRANRDMMEFYQNTQKRSVEASNAIAALRPKLQANAYYLDLTAVNAMPSAAFAFKSSEQEPLKSAEQRLAAALAAMPAVPAVYRDIGLIYFAAVNPWRAFMAWEMGMTVPGRSSEPNIWKHVPDLQAQARQRRPEFF